jgi:hypothetical protein
MGPSSENRLAVVIVIDGLRASALGAYGNTSFPTPLFDEIASRSLVAEWLLATGPTLGSFYEETFSGIDRPGVLRRLLTDDNSIASSAGAGAFAQVSLVDQGADHRAQEIESTHAAAFFSQAIEDLAVWQKEVAVHRSSGLLWLHFSGLSGPWDAPLAMRQDALDEDDPPAPEFVTPPSELRGVTDPDELLGYRVAYAAQVSVIETCIAGFVEALDELHFEGKVLAMIAGSRGFVLGEHGCVGYNSQSLYSEQLHLPWLIVSDETRGPLPRVSGFAQPADIGTTLARWLSSGDSDAQSGRSLVPFLDSQPGRLRDAVIASNAAGETMIRTPAWLMKQGSAIELYAKPDDRWEANDIASRCPEIVAQLSKHLEGILAGRAEPLGEELLSPWR